MALNIATSNIVAMAFAELKMSPPSGFAEDSEQARDAAAFYPQALDEVLEGTDWGFASVLADLPPLASAPGPTDRDLPHAYALPPDCLSLQAVGDDWTRWRLDASALRVDAPDSQGGAGTIRVRYTRRLTDEARLPASVRGVIALRLALLMLPRWGNSDDKRRLQDDYEVALRLARRSAARHAASENWTGRDHSDIVSGALR